MCVNVNLRRYLFAGGSMDFYTSIYYEHSDFYIHEMRIFVVPSKQIFFLLNILRSKQIVPILD